MERVDVEKWEEILDEELESLPDEKTRLLVEKLVTRVWQEYWRRYWREVMMARWKPRNAY
jgi:hypothetical protein